MDEIEGRNGGTLKPFKPGQSGNPGGKTSEQKRREMRNAEMATRIAEAQLEARVKLLEETLAAAEGDPTSILAVEALKLSGDLLKLVKDAQDRGLGAPTQTLAGDQANPVGIALVRRVIVDPHDGD